MLQHCSPLGRPGGRAGCGDSCRQQQAAGPGPLSGLPLSGTSCVWGQKPFPPTCILLPKLPHSSLPMILFCCVPIPVAFMTLSISKKSTFWIHPQGLSGQIFIQRPTNCSNFRIFSPVHVDVLDLLRSFLHVVFLFVFGDLCVHDYSHSSILLLMAIA